MKVQSLGHVVIRVRNQQRAEAFYNGVLGLPISARMEEYSMTFFSLGSHHDFAIMAVGDDAEKSATRSVGLEHVAFKIGERLEDLRGARDHLEASGIEVTASDHTVTQSLYLEDPDGNMIELFVDTSDAWKEEPALIATESPLDL